MYNSNWYDLLNKPFLTPPSGIFIPVWIVLYLALFIALILYTIKFSRRNKIKGYIFFVTQMILNLLWSPAFFGMKNMTLALIIVILLDIFAILMTVEFSKVSKISAIILVPYIIWILFATYLNIGFIMLN